VGLDDYRAFLRTSRLAETTQQTYGFYIGEFLTWAGEQQRGLADLSACDVLDWIDEHPGWSSSTRYSAATAVRSFYTWQYGEAHDVSRFARVRRLPSGPQRSLDWDQLDAVMDSFDLDKPKGVRDRAMIALLVDTGLREAEICRADLRHWDRRKRKIDVVIKGEIWGVAEYFDRTASYLSAWMELRDAFALSKTKTIFVSTNGKTKGAALTPGGLRAVFRKIGERAELEEGFSPHDCRRTFATLASLAGAPAQVIQRAGRWSSIEMVERYTRNLKPSDLKPFSPMDNLDKN
jgi:integrase/recombinase XerD